jgi:hypothetical protein
MVMGTIAKKNIWFLNSLYPNGLNRWVIAVGARISGGIFDTSNLQGHFKLSLWMFMYVTSPGSMYPFGQMVQSAFVKRILKQNFGISKRTLSKYGNSTMVS